MAGMFAYTKAAMERAMKIQEVMLRTTAKKITWYQAAEILMPRGMKHRVRDIEACGAHRHSTTAKAVNEQPRVLATSDPIGGQEQANDESA